VDERSDPEKSTRAAAHYLNDLFAMFKDWNLVLAAYNWGEGAVQRLINNTGMNDFWQLVDLRRKMPQETKNHVPLIQASVILGKNPEKFGLPTELFPPLKYSKVSVSKPLDLHAVAKVLSVSIDELKKLNPSLKGHITPANYPNFQLKVPEEVDSDLHDKLDDLPAAKYKAPAEAALRYKVRKGDTLMKIASKYRVSVLELRKANHLSSQKKQLAAGIWLQIPSKSVEKAEPKVKKAQSAKARSSKLIAGKTGTSKATTQTAKNSRSAKAKAKSSDSVNPKSKAAQKSATHQSNVKTASAKKKTHVKTDLKQIASR